MATNDLRRCFIDQGSFYDQRRKELKDEVSQMSQDKDESNILLADSRSFKFATSRSKEYPFNQKKLS